MEVYPPKHKNMGLMGNSKYSTLYSSSFFNMDGIFLT